MGLQRALNPRYIMIDNHDQEKLSVRHVNQRNSLLQIICVCNIIKLNTRCWLSWRWTSIPVQLLKAVFLPALSASQCEMITDIQSPVRYTCSYGFHRQSSGLIATRSCTALQKNWNPAATDCDECCCPTGLGRNDYVTSVLRDTLHWLPIRYGNVSTSNSQSLLSTVSEVPVRLTAEAYTLRLAA